MSQCCFQNSFRDTASMFYLRTSKRVSLGELIDHGFYPLLAMVYKCFKIYLLLYRVYLEQLQVQVLTRRKWCIWSYLEIFWALLEIGDGRRLPRNIDWRLPRNIDRRLPTNLDRCWPLLIDRQRSHPRVNDKLENFKSHKSFNNYILSLWPPVRLFIRVLYHFRGRLA